MTQQPMMYRSRNSMYLASQGGDMPLHAEEEADNNQNEDTLKGVPEMPEEEEAEALRMVTMHFIPIFFYIFSVTICRNGPHIFISYIFWKFPLIHFFIFVFWIS